MGYRYLRRIFSKKRSIRIPFFQIWYSSAFLLIAFVTWVATLVTPADMIFMCIREKNIANGISIGAVYVFTLVVAFFIWSSRIYTNRAVLKEIPRAYIPVEKDEVPRKVNKMIVKQWERSALVAWDARPRDVREELNMAAATSHGHGEHHGLRARLHRHATERTMIAPQVAMHAWGYISHPGWSSPARDDLPDLEYQRVFVELPNLIEAKAVSLVPPEPEYLQALQRPTGQGLREYLDRLTALGLGTPEAAEHLLAQYERARFSTDDITEAEFTELMASFAAFLAGMDEGVAELDTRIMIYP